MTATKNQDNAERKSILYLEANTICAKCPHRHDCDKEWQDDHLSVEILQDFDNQEIFHGGYICTGNPHNNVPYHKGFSENVHFSSNEELSLYYQIIQL